ncbi:hypothetical protein C8R43DRAFT_1113706, partial [Mycena crocata]
MCLGGDETVDPTKPEWSRRRPTSAQRDLERQARNSPSEMLYPPGVDYGFPSCARVPGSLRGMGSSCSPEQLDGLAAVKGVCTETDRKISSPPRNRRVVNHEMKFASDRPPRNRKDLSKMTRRFRLDTFGLTNSTLNLRGFVVFLVFAFLLSVDGCETNIFNLPAKRGVLLRRKAIQSLNPRLNSEWQLFSEPRLRVMVQCDPKSGESSVESIPVS